MEEPFEKVLVRFDPLIKALIRRYSLNLEFDEMYQVGRIALWEAFERFDEEKGAFPAFAKRYISGRLLQMVNKRRVKTVDADEHIVEEYYSFIVPFLDEIIIHEYVQHLSDRERLYVDYIILQQGSMKDLARQEGVSYETVRSWRKNALEKLRMRGQNV